MSLNEWLSDARYRLRALFRRADLERELDEELRFHLEQEAARLVTSGVAPDEALRRARVAFGGLSRIKDDSRDRRGVSAIETVAADLRYAARRLRASPGFTAVAVLTLAVGIGATTAIFSAVNPILLQPLPYPGAGRIMMVIEDNGDGTRNDGSFGMYRGLAERSRRFEAMTVMRPWSPALSGSDRPEQLEGQRVSASYFTVLGVSPALGRDFQAGDDEPGAPLVAIISHGLWQRRLGGDSAVIGQSVALGDNSYTIIGVMPPGFENILAPGAEVWTTLQYQMSEGRAWGHHLRTAGRVRPGVTAEAARADIQQAGDAVLAEQQPPTYAATGVRFAVTPLQDDVTRGVKSGLLAILGAVALVLIIACVNVTNLLLARGAQRRGELALRAALGAGRGRLVRQLLTEGLLLALSGGAAGIAVAVFGVRALVALDPADLPRAGAIAVDGTALAFALGVVTLIGLAFGIVPALQGVVGDTPASLQQGSHRNAGSHHRTRGALVVAEVALAMVLLVTSGLLLRSLNRLFTVDSGFDARGVLTMQVQTTGRRFADTAAANLFRARVLDAVRRVPGVTAAELTSQLPMSGDREEYGVMFEGIDGGFSSYRYGVSPGYLAFMRIPLVRGRALETTDHAGGPLVALVSDGLARRLFPDADPIGRRLTIGPIGPFTIAGVVGDVRQLSLAASQADAVYVSADQWPFTDAAVSLVVRGRGDVTALAPALREAVWSVDQDRPITRIATLDALVASTASERQFALILFEAFALAALVLAAAGIYGVLAGSVAERTREIGVRAALGASRATIVRLVVRQGLSLATLGVVIGFAGAITASKAIVALLFEVSPLDPFTYGAVIALLLAVALLACCVPAWRAARVDPAMTLRSD